jgi:hypothetical protein
MPSGIRYFYCCLHERLWTNKPGHITTESFNMPHDLGDLPAAINIENKSGVRPNDL